MGSAAGRRTATRRRFMAGMAGGLLPHHVASALAWPALRTAAATRGILYGSCVSADQVRAGGDFADLLRRECAVLVTENELKWSRISDQPGVYDFTRADAIVGFAAAHGLAMRGHTLVWYRRTPAWFGTLGPHAGADALRRHIAALVGRYRGRFRIWDVVNEPIELSDGRADGLRGATFLETIGPEYIELAFAAAREIDPDARLLLNEYDIEYDLPEHEAKRVALLRLLERLKRAGAPVDMLGIQAHLAAGRFPFSGQRLRAFLREAAGLGLELAITELDVADSQAPADVARRDRIVADEYARFLEAALDERALTLVMTWGLADLHSWIVRGESGDRRSDGVASRPLPFDAALQRKPAWHAVIRSFDTAPARAPDGRK